MTFEISILLFVSFIYLTVISVHLVLSHRQDAHRWCEAVNRRWSWIKDAWWSLIALVSTSGALYCFRTITTQWIR